MPEHLAKPSGRDGPADEHVALRGMSSDYLDGDLDTETAERVRDHLEWCPPCRSFVDTLKATVGLLSSTARRDAPESFRNRLLKRLQQWKAGERS